MGRRTTRQLWAAFIEGKSVARADVPAPAAGRRFHGLVLGIDPSLRGTGWAVVLCERDAHRLVASGTVRLPARIPFATCLGRIHGAVAEAVERHAPACAAVEETIYVQNARTAQILGAARGAAMSAVALRGVPLHEYAPRRIKQAVVGTGAASKEQVQRTLRTLLGMPDVLPPDEADAAATALCHAFTWRGD